MGKLTIDEIIGHCERKTEQYERLFGKERLETTPLISSTIKEYWEHRQVAEYLKKLKEYQQLEEQGRLIKLPCKVGDVVYVTEPALVEAMCIRIQLDGYRNGIWINAKEYPYDRWISFKAFGKTVFLTKSEAEAKLKELRGGEDGSME